MCIALMKAIPVEVKLEALMQHVENIHFNVSDLRYYWTPAGWPVTL